MDERAQEDADGPDPMLPAIAVATEPGPSRARRLSIGVGRTFAALVSIASDRPFLEDGWVRVPVAERRGTIADAVRRLDDAVQLSLGEDRSARCPLPEQSAVKLGQLRRVGTQRRESG